MYKRIQTLLAVIFFGIAAKGQGIPLGETILMNNSPIKENVDPEVFRSYMMQEFLPAWNAGSHDATMYLLQADRGEENGGFLTICVTDLPGGKKIQKEKP